MLRHTSKSTAYFAFAAAALLAAIVVALLDGRSVPGEAFALACLAAAIAVPGVTTRASEIARRSEASIVDRIDKAPREAYYRGYGDASADALNDEQLH